MLLKKILTFASNHFRFSCICSVRKLHGTCRVQHFSFLPFLHVSKCTRCCKKINIFKAGFNKFDHHSAWLRLHFVQKTLSHKEHLILGLQDWLKLVAKIRVDIFIPLNETASKLFKVPSSVTGHLKLELKNLAFTPIWVKNSFKVRTKFVELFIVMVS